MHLPFRIAQPLCVHAIETVSQVDAERAERCDDRTTYPDTAEQSRRIEVRRSRPQVSGVVEGIQVQHLVEAKAELRALRVEHVAEGLASRLVRTRLRDITVRRDGEPLVAPQRLAVLHAAQREGLRHEEGTRIAEHAAHSCRESENQLDRRGTDRALKKLA